MKKVDSIKLQLSQHQKAREKLTKELKEIVKDKGIPLDIRWDLFISSGLGEDSIFSEKPPGVDTVDYLINKHFHSRYEIVEVAIFLEIILDAEDIEDFDEVTFKEYFLEEFVKSFKLDW